MNEAPLPLWGLGDLDLDSLELDAAAIEHGSAAGSPRALDGLLELDTLFGGGDDFGGLLAAPGSPPQQVPPGPQPSSSGGSAGPRAAPTPPGGAGVATTAAGVATASTAVKRTEAERAAESKRLRNRESAAASRARKKQRYEELEQRTLELEEQRKRLAKEAMVLRAENATLRARLGEPPRAGSGGGTSTSGADQRTTIAYVQVAGADGKVSLRQVKVPTHLVQAVSPPESSAARAPSSPPQAPAPAQPSPASSSGDGSGDCAAERVELEQMAPPAKRPRTTAAAAALLSVFAVLLIFAPSSSRAPSSSSLMMIGGGGGGSGTWPAAAQGRLGPGRVLASLPDGLNETVDAASETRIALAQADVYTAAATTSASPADAATHRYALPASSGGDASRGAADHDADDKWLPPFGSEAWFADGMIGPSTCEELFVFSTTTAGPLNPPPPVVPPAAAFRMRRAGGAALVPAHAGGRGGAKTGPDVGADEGTFTTSLSPLALAEAEPMYAPLREYVRALSKSRSGEDGAEDEKMETGEDGKRSARGGPHWSAGFGAGASTTATDGSAAGMVVTVLIPPDEPASMEHPQHPQHEQSAPFASLSRVWVVVALEASKYATYSCRLPTVRPPTVL
mmetsp:Transcript_26639/g.87347  ORF Transcript_26639/g.87347 Transcript_26639/m.87347 type:complete len:625 (+) Transcript_26639:2-1876(+)